MRTLCWFADFSLCTPVAEGNRHLSGASFVRTVIPFIRALALWPYHFQKTHWIMPSPLGVWISTYEFSGDTNIHTIATTTGRVNQISKKSPGHMVMEPFLSPILGLVFQKTTLQIITIFVVSVEIEWLEWSLCNNLSFQIIDKARVPAQTIYTKSPRNLSAMLLLLLFRDAILKLPRIMIQCFFCCCCSSHLWNLNSSDWHQSTYYHVLGKDIWKVTL